MDMENQIIDRFGPLRHKQQYSPTFSKCFASSHDYFTEDFMFHPTDSGVDFMVSQNAIPSRKYLGGSLPYVFTEQGKQGTGV